MNNKIIISVGGLIIVVLAFFGGMKYAESKGPTRMGAFGQNGTFRVGRGGQNGGGLVNGDVIAQDSTSITVKTRDGSSKIVFISPATAVMKAVSGSASDLTLGESITAIGTAN